MYLSKPIYSYTLNISNSKSPHLAFKLYIKNVFFDQINHMYLNSLYMLENFKDIQDHILKITNNFFF